MRDKLINFGLSYGVLTAFIFPMYVFEDIDSIGYYLLMCLAYAPLTASISIRNDLSSAKTELYVLREYIERLEGELLEDGELKQ